MDAIQSSTTTAGTQQISQSGSAAASSSIVTTAGSQSGSASMISTSSQQSVTMASVNTQVSTMLGAVDQSLASNDILKFLVAMLIMEALLGESEDGSLSQLLQMAIGMGVGGQSSGPALMSMSMESSSMSIQSSATASMSQQISGQVSYGEQPDQQTEGGSVDVVV